MNNLKLESSDNLILKILKGIMVSFIITLISIFIFAILLTYTNISEKVIPLVIIGITSISILIGTMMEVRKITKNGMVNGGIIGGIYVVILYLISSILSTGFTLNMYTTLMITIGILSGIIGGIIGINT